VSINVLLIIQDVTLVVEIMLVNISH